MNGPYKGLAAYEDDELDARLFFGREREREIVIANLMGSRLTVLYGASGVGKSSLLRAGVAHRLRRSARESDARHGDPEHAVVLFGAWSDDPLGALVDEVVESVQPGLGRSGNGSYSLVDAVTEASETIEGQVYVILDQFEEFFVYQDEAAAERFGAQLADVVRTEGLRANVLVSLRDDALAELDRFAAKLPAILANSVRLEHLDRAAGRAAIVRPLARHAALTGEPEIGIEDALVEAVLDEVTTGRVAVSNGGAGSAGDAGARVEAPYLQLVMERLWQIETGAGSNVLRLSTFRELGGAAPIVEAHFEDAVDALPPEQRELAARIFGHLVTPSGTKISHAAGDLARYAHVEDDELEPVLASLADARILRPVAPANGARDSTRFEIFHDVLAEPVLSWKRRYEADRKLEAERVAARRRQRRLAVVTAASLLAVAAMVAVTVFALTQRNEAREQSSVARSRELAAAAESELSSDPELGVLLALEAARARPTPEAEDALRRALIATRAELVLPLSGEAGQAAAVNGDGEVEAVTTTGTLRRFAADTGELVGEPLVGDGRAVAAAIDPSGSYAATARPDGVVRVVDTESGEEISTVEHGGPVAAASFDADGSLLVTAGRDGRARIWRTATGSPVAQVDHGAALAGAAVSPGQTLLATAGRDGVTRLWALPAGTLVREIGGHRGAVADVGFSNDGAVLVTGGTDGRAQVVEVATGDLIATMSGHGNAITSVAVSPDGEWIATGGRDRTARIWELETARLVAVLLGHGDGVTSVGFDPASETIVTASADGTVRLWGATPDAMLSVVAQLDGPALAASFLAAGETIAIAGPRNAITVLDAASGATVTTLAHDAPVTDVATAPGGNVLGASGSEAVLQAVETGEIVQRFAHGGPVVAVAVSPDGSRVATAGADGVARVYETEDAAVELRLTGSDASLTDVAFSPDGRLLATSGADKLARIWNLETGALEHELRGHRDDVTSVAFSPDGAFVVTSSRDHDARVWNASSGALEHVLRAHFAAVQDAQYSPDGRWIVTAGPSTAGLWSADGELLFYIRGHEAPLTSASFGPDGRRIVTTSEDGTVRRFDCVICGSLDDLEALAAERLGRLGRTLTDAERARYVENDA